MKRSIGAKTVLNPTPVLVVGTYDAEGRSNATTASWGGICCSKPSCLAVSLRAATMAHGNIMARKAFTVSVPSANHVHELGLHMQFVGEILDVKIDEGCLDEEGNPDAGRIAPFFFAPQDRHYYGRAVRIAKGMSVGCELKAE